jgi:predicted transcriptional regulator YdeE
MNPRLTEKPAFTVAGVTATGHPSQLNYAQIWEHRYMPLDAALKPLSLDGGYYGVSLSEAGQLVYLAGMAVPDSAALPPGAEHRMVPAARYAVFDCGLDAIGATWKYAYERWLPTSGFEVDSTAVDFEFYPPVGPDGAQQVEIYIPVKPKD